MKKYSHRSLILLVSLFLPICSFAQTNEEQKVKTNQKDRPPKISVELSVGSYTFPGFLLDIAPISKHPDNLRGRALGANLRYNLKQGWSVGVEGTYIDSNGFGEWAEEGSEAVLRKEGVIGSTTGTLNLRMRTFTLFVQKEFRLEKRFSPYFRLGGGGGILTSDFHGEFRGVSSTEYKGKQIEIKISEPAYYHKTRTIPAIGAETGATFKINKNLAFSGAGYWNTGYGVKGGLVLRF